MAELASKKWAKALIELAQEENLSMEAVLSDLRNISETLKSSSELLMILNNPSVSTEEKQIVICKLFQDKVAPIVYNFLFVLNLKKRINIISEIADEFESEYERLKNIVRVDITSAINLSDDRKTDIKDKVAEKIKKEVKVNWEVNADIIAGLVFNVNDTVIDNSIKHKLDKISESIIRV